MRFEDAFTKPVVSEWSEAKRAAWRGRLSNAGEFLYRLLPPAPGARQATGAFSAEEAQLFDRRVEEFRSKGWPLACWGLFSLALPHRVGYQCSAHYKKSGHYDAAAERIKPTAAAVAACQQQLGVTVKRLFAAPAAQRVAVAVDQWLAEAEAVQPGKAVGRQLQPNQLVKQRGVAVGSADSSGSDFEDDTSSNRGVSKVVKRGSGNNAGRGGSKRPSGPQRTQPAAPAQQPPAAGHVQQREGLVGAGMQAPAAPLNLQVALGRQQQSLQAPSQKQLASKPALQSHSKQQMQQPARQQQQQQPPAQQQVQQQQSAKAPQQQAGPPGCQQPKPAAAGPKRQAMTAGNRPVVAKKQRLAPAQQQRHQQRRHQPKDAGSYSSSSDEDDLFMAGTLKQSAQPLPPPPKPVAAPPAKKSGAGVAAAAAAAAGDGFGSKVALIRLDTLDPARWPGWQASVAGIRTVAPYQPVPASAGGGSMAAGTSGSSSSNSSTSARVELTGDILAYDLCQLGSSFQAVLLNTGSSCLDELAERLRLGKQLLSSGLLMVWAAKGQLAAVARLMAANGFKYVESLTWLQLGPNNQPLQGPSPLFRSSHLTLVMGRRGAESKQHLELRHQRSPDVIASPAVAPGHCPEAVYQMVETLLPDAAAAAKSGSPPRLLELCWSSSSSSSSLAARPGWIKLVHAGEAVQPGSST